MSDLISRQAAIDRLMREIRSYAEGPRYRDVVTGLKIAVMVIQEKVPSAQPKPDENTLSEQQESDKLGVKTGETCTDCISRQAAIKATWEEPSYTDPLNVLTEVRDRLEALPSAKPNLQPTCNKLATDCISRQAVIDALDSINCFGWVEDSWKNVCSIIERVPSARRKGKWIYLNELDAFECSVCGRQMVRNIFDYCPWCGAEMTKGEEDE